MPALVIDPNCPLTLHAAVIDRDRQRAWLCDHGVALPEFVITTARDQPDPGTYPVYTKSMHASSRFGGHYSTMTHFVAFARGEETGARSPSTPCRCCAPVSTSNHSPRSGPK